MLQDFFAEDFLAWMMARRSILGLVVPGAERRWSRPLCTRGERSVFLSPYMRSWYAEESAPTQQPPEFESGKGRNCWKAATCWRASLYLSTTALTASPNRPEGASGASMRQTRSLSLIFERVSHKCLSTPTIAATKRPMARAVSLVARRDKSAVRRSSEISSDLISLSSTNSYSSSAWYACNTAIVCRHAPAWSAAANPLPTSADDQRWCYYRRQIACERLFDPRHRSVAVLIQPRHITVVIRRGNEEAGRERLSPWSRHLSAEIGEEWEAPAWRWWPRRQKAFV